jgi:PEP-CTERM motif/Dockerin type I domain
MRYLAAGVGLLLLMAHQSPAVIIYDGDGSGNTTAPADDFGFANVGIRGSGTAIYLEDGWVLTADHVGDGTTLFQNVAYAEVPGSAVQLTNPPGTGYTPYSDLLMYKIASPPDLPPVMITQTAPAPGWQVTMVGNGRDRNASEAYWTSTWAPANSPSPYAGYIWSSTNDIRWGTNVINSVSLPVGIDANSEVAFSTVFGPPGSGLDAQGAPGDSGGGVFHQDASGAWSLAGLMFSINTQPGEPWGVSAFGDITYSADLSVYRSEIYHIMALPGDANFDGVVNGQDLALVAENWMKTGTGANDPAGDVNHDGIVNGQDMALIESNWTTSNFAASKSSSSAVPEPSTILLAALGAVALMAWRWRR